MHHILSVSQFDKDMLKHLCASADQHLFNVKMGHVGTVGRGRLLVNLFYEPSTRTSTSFHSAMLRLGGDVIQINDVQFSSVVKGESLEDTIRAMECNADIIVLRHPETGAASRAAKVAKVPIINAGDGMNEHPTQALLDFYTIQKSFHAIDGLHVVMMGDLLRGRTVKSLAKLLRLYDVKISWVSPPALQIEPSFIASGEVVTDDVSAVIATADVLYLTRAQTERKVVVESWNDASELVYGVSLRHMELAPQHMLLMHPLPRTSELPVELDRDPRSVYFQQMYYGLYMRMAIIGNVLQEQLF